MNHSKPSFRLNTKQLYCSIELVDDCIMRLKRGKAAGHHELTVEHLLYIYPSCSCGAIVIELAVFANMLALHGTVPLDFGKGVVIPLIKDFDADKTIIEALLLAQYQVKFLNSFYCMMYRFFYKVIAYNLALKKY